MLALSSRLVHGHFPRMTMSFLALVITLTANRKVNGNLLKAYIAQTKSVFPFYASFNSTTRMNAENFVESALKSKKVVIFSKSSCPYCAKAKQALGKFNLSDDIYLVIELDKEEKMDEIQDYLQKKTGARSVPRVFINGTFIGGGDDTVRLEKSGELKKLLENAGAI